MNAEDLPTTPGPLVGGPNPEPVRSRRPISRSRRWAQRIGAPLTLGLLRGLWSTYRIRVNGEAPLASLAAKHQPVVLTFWHGELIVGSWYFLRMAQLGFTLTFLISPVIAVPTVRHPRVWKIARVRVFLRQSPESPEHRQRILHWRRWRA
jgi:hypothetical protein